MSEPNRYRRRLPRRRPGPRFGLIRRWLPTQPARFSPGAIVEAAQAFVRLEAASGLVVLLAVLLALAWANSRWDTAYFDLWQRRAVIDTGVFRIDMDLRGWINNGLMTLFFFLIGLEIKRELVHGELSEPRKALLPAMAALGGMIAPALIYTAINHGGPGADGWAVPMATDVALALGVLYLLGARVPLGVKIFLLALAISDDIGSIAVLTVFYPSDLRPLALGIALVVLAGIFVLKQYGVESIGVYAIAGVALWTATYESGISATVVGAALGLLTPARERFSPSSFAAEAKLLTEAYEGALAADDEDAQQAILAQIEELSRGTEAPLDRLERALHPWVSFGVVPLFALANAGVALSGGAVSDAVASPVLRGVVTGRLLGKPLGIVLFTWLAVRLRLGVLPLGMSWRQVLGVGLLGGIGFAVAILVASLAFDDPAQVSAATLGLLAASSIAGIAGAAVLWLASPTTRPNDP